MHQQTECGANMECVPQRVANRRVWWCQWVPMVGANGSHNASWVIVCGGSGEGNVLDGKEMMHEHVPFSSAAHILTSPPKDQKLDEGPDVATPVEPAATTVNLQQANLQASFDIQMTKEKTGEHGSLLC